jgi:hypothetical protein
LTRLVNMQSTPLCGTELKEILSFALPVYNRSEEPGVRRYQ